MFDTVCRRGPRKVRLKLPDLSILKPIGPRAAPILLGKLLHEIIAGLRSDLELIDKLIAVLERIQALQNGSTQRARRRTRDND